MTKQLQSAGYIVYDDEAIWGLGATKDEAWRDFLHEMGIAHVAVVGTLGDLERGSDATAKMPGELGPESVRASGYKIAPATDALLERVKKWGGNIAWRQVGAVACTDLEVES